MLNQIGQATHYLFARIAIRHFKHFLHTFPKQTLNNFCSQDYIKAFKYQRKIDEQHLFDSFIHKSKSHQVHLTISCENLFLKSWKTYKLGFIRP